MIFQRPGPVPLFVRGSPFNSGGTQIRPHVFRHSISLADFICQVLSEDVSQWCRTAVPEEATGLSVLVPCL